MNNTFANLVDSITDIGVEHHRDTLIERAKHNVPFVKKSIKELAVLSGKKAESGIVISAGPGVHQKKSIEKIRDTKYEGTTVAADGAYIACLKRNYIPDYVITLDPHYSRIVRWFGDPDFEKHTANDDFFSRQDLDIEFRKNSIEQNKQHIELVNKHGHQTKAIVATTAPANVVARMIEAKMDMYWWNPLVDNPRQEGSITRELYNINKLPCLNTGGTVGTAAWVFLNSHLNVPRVAVVGMDLGYYHTTPIEKTQTYYELIKHLGGDEKLAECFVEFEFPLTKEKFYTDPTYFWYRRNFLDLLKKAQGKTFNCTESGTLFAEEIPCITLDSFLTQEGRRH